MALLASGHAALETVSQIGIADFVEDCDNLLLLGVGDFHFACCGHASIYVERSFEPRFSEKCGWSGWRCGCRTILEHPRRLLSRYLSRSVHEMPIRHRLWIATALTIAEVMAWADSA